MHHCMIKTQWIHSIDGNCIASYCFYCKCGIGLPRLELGTCRLEGGCSIQLSYGRGGATLPARESVRNY